MSGDVPRPPGAGQDPPARHLKLVHPAPPPKPKEKRRRGPPFSREEQARLRAALKNARALFGSWACLADALRVCLGTIEQAARGTTSFTGDLAVRLARALGKPVESLYAAPSGVTLCPTCGARRAP